MKDGTCFYTSISFLTGKGTEILIDAENNVIAIFKDGNMARSAPCLEETQPIQKE